MNIEASYQKHKNKRAEYRGITGIVCGYSKQMNLLIMAIEYENESSVNYGISEQIIAAQKGIILNRVRNQFGYMYVGVEDLIH